MLANIFRAFFSILIGLSLVVLKDSAIPFLVRMVGAAFLLPALVSAVNLFLTRKEASAFPLLLVSLADVGSMLFGAWLLVSPATFLELLVVLLAIALLCFSVFQIYKVLSLRNGISLRWGLLLVPLSLAVASIIVLANPFETVATVSVMLGICAVISGISDIVILLAARKYISGNVEKSDFYNEMNL